MRWERFFEDLEDQLDSEWEAERAALDSEAERLRMSQRTLRERLVATVGGELGIELAGGAAASGRVVAVGADWCGLDPVETRGGTVLVPLWSVRALTMSHEGVLRAARSAGPGSSLSQRMTFGFVLRDLVRKRVPVSVELGSQRALTGTIDRAGADHLDIALHDPGLPRRADAVTGFRIVPFTAIAAIRLASALPLL